MRHSRIPSLSAATAILGLSFGLFCSTAEGQAQARWTVKMRALQNPLPLGQCTAIEVTVTDATGAAPVRPDRRQVDWQDFDLSFASPTADAFAWSDPAHPRFLCSRAPTATSALVVAYYPARHLTAAEVVPGINAQETIEVVLQGSQLAAAASVPSQPYVPAQASTSPPQGQGSVAPNQAAGAAGASQQAGAAPNQAAGAGPAAAGAAGAAGAVGTAGAAGGAPQGQNYAQPTTQAAGAGPAAAGAAGGAPQGQNYAQPTNQAASAGPAAAGAAGAAGGAPQGQNYVPPTNQAAASAPAGQYVAPANPQPATGQAGVTPTPVSTAGAPVQLTTQPAEKKGGGFFKKLGKHLKEKASEVGSQTATNLTNSATQVVDATAQTGSNLVSGAAAEVTSVAQSKVGSVSTALVPSALKGGAGADNLRVAVASGYAELRMMRFITNTEVLDVAGRDLVRNLAQVLKEISGNYVIQAHVDQLPSPADPGASQVLSEHRAAAVKKALIGAGVDASRLTALGYGTSDPKPVVPAEGGLPSSARIVIAKLQQ
jgi:outer membrane protein OmpA-like peptidoglycan-associated protein